LREREIEQKLTQTARRKGGLALKFSSPGIVGVPDRILLMPGGHMAFAELKAPGNPLRPLQVRRKQQLEVLGFRVYIIDNVQQIGGMLDEVCSS